MRNKMNPKTEINIAGIYRNIESKNNLYLVFPATYRNQIDNIQWHNRANTAKYEKKEEK